jgi:hypothetical protein
VTCSREIELRVNGPERADDEDVQSLKGGGHHDEEVAGQLSRPTTALLCAEYNSHVHPSLSDLKLIFYFV